MTNKMTNKERYQRTFSTLHTSCGMEEIMMETLERMETSEPMKANESMETSVPMKKSGSMKASEPLKVNESKKTGEPMKAKGKKNKFHMPKWVAACVAFGLVFASTTVVYAADVGGIQRNIQIWLHGDQTDAVLDIQNGQYTLTYEDEEGNRQERGGGGIAFGPGGKERALTEAEIMEHLDRPEVRHEEDGTVWVYYRSQKLEITDKFDEDGICYVHLKDGKDNWYMTISYHDHVAMSPHSYIDPKTFHSRGQ